MKTRIITGITLLAVPGVIFLTTQNSCKVVDEKGKSQAWGENCVRCHNVPSPSEYSDAQWEIIVKHMHIRAGLTDDEAQKIAEFLKTAN